MTTQTIRPTLDQFLAGEKVEYCSFSGEPLTAKWMTALVPHLVIENTAGVKLACPITDRSGAISFYGSLDLVP